jgi:hypothetical protein
MKELFCFISFSSRKQLEASVVHLKCFSKQPDMVTLGLANKSKQLGLELEYRYLNAAIKRILHLRL